MNQTEFHYPVPFLEHVANALLVYSVDDLKQESSYGEKMNPLAMCLTTMKSFESSHLSDTLREMFVMMPFHRTLKNVDMRRKSSNCVRFRKPMRAFPNCVPGAVQEAPV